MTHATETQSDVDLLGRARRVTPGASQTRSKAPGRVGPRDLRAGFPLFAERGVGPYLYAGGRRYLDFAGANAAVPLGYAHPEVVGAVAEAVGSGSLLSLPSRLEVEASEALCEAVGAERVRWVRTGSEAVTAAVKLARAATGASAVVVAEHSYHGWHDWTLARFTGGVRPGPHCLPNGVPSVLGPTVLTYDYMGADPDEAVAAAHAAGQRVAAVVVEPHRFYYDQKERLERARHAASAAGAVLVFDEMVYGFRWRRAGGQEFFGVRPDLSCYGKALGNGVPVACVAGRAAVMDRAETLVTSTYGGDRVGLAAATAVLRIHRQPDAIDRIWASGKAFWDEFVRLSGDEWRLKGFPVHFAVRWDSDAEADDVLTRCAERGVLFHRDACNASACMTEAEAREGARVLAEELHRGHAK